MSHSYLSSHIVILFLILIFLLVFFFFFFNDTATTEIYTLSLHDALPISRARPSGRSRGSSSSARRSWAGCPRPGAASPRTDRKSTRLNSSHLVISYAVFCLKKKKKKEYKANYVLRISDITICKTENHE